MICLKVNQVFQQIFLFPVFYFSSFLKKTIPSEEKFCFLMICLDFRSLQQISSPWFFLFPFFSPRIQTHSHFFPRFKVCSVVKQSLQQIFSVPCFFPLFIVFHSKKGENNKLDKKMVNPYDAKTGKGKKLEKVGGGNRKKLFWKIYSPESLVTPFGIFSLSFKRRCKRDTCLDKHRIDYYIDIDIVIDIWLSFSFHFWSIAFKLEL